MIYINKLSIKTNDSRELSELEKRIYWIRNDKSSNYKYYNKNKETGKIRIGCFGDSFTYGEEVGFSYDYPSQLQKIFNKSGYGYEVINFGMGYQGFHQSYMIWRYLGKEYNLDYVILGPEGFQNDRDSTFNHTFSFNYLSGIPEYVHSRYILNGSDVSLIDLHGNRINERIKDYWGFLPRYRYIRYDREIPVFLRSVIALFRPNTKILLNPFYYKDNIKEEMNAIYSILLAKISLETANTIVGNYNTDIIDITNKINKKNLNGYVLFRPYNFAYIAYSEHNSPLGNSVLAEQIYGLVMNKKQINIEIINPVDSFVGLEKIVSKQTKKLSDYDDIYFSIKNNKIANFYDTSITEWERYCNEPNCITNIKVFKNVTSLIGFSKNNFTDSVFIPINTPLNQNIKIKIIIKSNSLRKEFNLGEIKVIHSGINIGMVDLGDYKLDRWTPSRIGKIKFFNLFDDIGKISKKEIIYIQVANEIILSASRNNEAEYEFFPVNRGFLIIRGTGNKILDISKLGNIETIFLNISENNRKLEIPVGKVEKTHVEVDF